jgi:hypothetical protein
LMRLGRIHVNKVKAPKSHIRKENVCGDVPEE